MKFEPKLTEESVDTIGAWFTSLDPTIIPLGALVTLMVISLIRGWVIPRQVHLDRMSDMARQIEMLVIERDKWQAAYEEMQKSNTKLLGQNSDLIDATETTNRLIESLRNHIERDSYPPRKTEG